MINRNIFSYIHRDLHRVLYLFYKGKIKRITRLILPCSCRLVFSLRTLNVSFRTERCNRVDCVNTCNSFTSNYNYNLTFFFLSRELPDLCDVIYNRVGIAFVKHEVSLNLRRADFLLEGHNAAREFLCERPRILVRFLVKS